MEIILPQGDRVRVCLLEKSNRLRARLLALVGILPAGNLNSTLGLLVSVTLICQTFQLGETHD
ncbi:MAG TPA: hypothetical protein DCP31_12950 [Cyanobacteria bacterium UBA8543]|nr:hypothetical protein [Cyanobacteria bacterium UBA8543]